MKASGQTLVNLNDLIDALDMTSNESNHFLNLEDGKITYQMAGEDFLDIDEQFDQEPDPSQFILLPNEWDINKYKIMEDFCYTVDNDEIQERLIHAIRGSGAFGRFKTAVYCFKIEEQWLQFLHEQLKEIAIEFCFVHKLKYHYQQMKNS